MGFGNKVTNLENRNKNISVNSEKKIVQLTNEISKLNNKLLIKNASKAKASQTDSEEKSSKKIQTENKEYCDLGTQTDTKNVDDIENLNEAKSTKLNSSSI